MIKSHYHQVFLVRFLGYVLTFVGVGTILLIVEPVFGEETKYRYDQLFNITHSLPQIVTSAGTQQISNPQSDTSLGSLAFNKVEMINPIDTEFGIVIEKINANAKVIPNVDSTNEQQYVQALAGGVAHAKGTALPGQVGNIYLFSHSIDAPWNVVRYNAIFYLLNKMEPGDRIIMFYQGRRYDYLVYDKAVVGPGDTHFLTDSYDQSVLTLQTCDPPGTLLNRLIVRAKLQNSD